MAKMARDHRDRRLFGLRARPSGRRVSAPGETYRV